MIHDLQKEATEKAVASARALALGFGVIPISKLSTEQWGLIVSAAIFEWLRIRYAQAIDSGIDPELGFADCEPSPRNAALVESILPRLADEAGIDWAKSVGEWSQEEMIGFLMTALRIIEGLERGMKDVVLQPHNKRGTAAEFDDGIPF
jgi:hypothetical protein